MDSCCALAINEQVLTTMTSASSALGVSSAPAWASMPIITSLSTRFLGQPRLTKPTLAGAAGLAGADMFFFAGTGNSEMIGRKRINLILAFAPRSPGLPASPPVRGRSPGTKEGT